MPVWKSRGFKEAVVVAVICIAAGGAVIAQDMPGSTVPSAPTAPAAEPAPNPAAQPPQAAAQPAPPPPAPAQPAAAQPTAQSFSAAQLDQLVAPIALYPDPLLSQMLMASTYPLEVVEADRWLRDPTNKSLTGDALTTALKSQNWDPSVMALAPFPRVLAVMADQLQWTEQLGNAFLAQQGDVMAAVQRLRHAALAAGNLKQTPECHCIIQTSGDQIAILPAAPQLVCIPVYNPTYVYGPWWEPAYPPIVFPVPVGFFYPPGFWIGYEPPIEVAVFGPLWGWGWFDWPGRRILVNNVVFGRLDPGHPAFAGGVWVHDPAHRLGVAYASTAVAARFGGRALPGNVTVLRGPGTFGNRAVAGRLAAAPAAGTLSTVGRGFIGHPGMVSHGIVARGPGSFHTGSFVHNAAPQMARGPVAPVHFSPGAGGPHAVSFAHGPVGAGPRGRPAGGPHSGGPGGHH